MKKLTLDVESTCLKINPKELDGNPLSRKNFLVYVGMLDNDGIYHDFPIEYGDEPYGESLVKIQELVNKHDVLIGFNIKFDLLWLLRYGISIVGKRVWDAQLAEFVLSNQLVPFPSLDDSCRAYGLDGKLDVVKEQFWNKGIDTEHIPKETLVRYLEQDVRQTWNLFLHQDEIISDSKRRLLSLQNQDLVCLLEIEKNGMLYDVETSKAEGERLQEKINEIDEKLGVLVGTLDFNPSSGDHISAVIYGGTIKLPYRETFTFTYKDGRTKEKQRWATKEVVFPRLVDPIKGSELKKEGFYSTSEDTLASLKPKGKAKTIISLLQERAKIETKITKYLLGIPKKIEEMDWNPNMLHGQLNQCVARTGRLSSSKPNMQNFDKTLGYLFRTRYE